MIYCGTHGFVDDIPVDDVRRFEAELRAYLRARHDDLLATIRTTGAMPDEGDLDKAIEDFKQGFAVSAGRPSDDDADAPAADAPAADAAAAAAAAPVSGESAGEAGSGDGA